MDNYDLSGPEAWHSLHDNPAARWASGLQQDPAPGTAWQRINDGPFFEPILRPEFSIDRSDRVFAIGSCFARNVEASLHALGFTVDSLTDALDEFPVHARRNTPIGYMNKYNAESIYNELRWALTETGFPDEALVPGENGLWEDPHTSPVFEDGAKELMLRRHGIMTGVVRRVPECRIVVITLGLVETFLDTYTGLYTNCTPTVSAQKDRFRFRVLSYDEVLDALDRIHRLLGERGHPDTQIVVTVSPVPLDATFTGQDIVIANMFSKSLLRAAAGHWAASHENVHYFPSYEIVMNSDREAAWERDGRHVQWQLVHHIMELFARTHVAAEESASVAAQR